MLTVEEALARLLAQARPIADAETVPTLSAHGRVLAQPVVSTLDVPPMDNSQMDGYAVRCADVPAAPVTLRVTQRIAAGHPGEPLAPGTAARIFTGAPVPAGADAVIMQERCEHGPGGVSVGEEDHVKPAVQAEGALDLWQIAMKPGKPLAFGAVRGVPFIGLPGNPVSSFVTFLLFARPFLLRRQGVAEVEPRALPLRADFDWLKPDRRREFLRVCVNAQGGLDVFGNQNSAVLTSTAWADGLIDHPAGSTIRRGQTVRYLPFAELLA